MPNLSEILKQIQRDLSCPVCGRNYQIGGIRVRGMFDHALIIQTVCANNHVTLFMTSLRKQEKNGPIINSNDIIALHRALENFDGNFQRLWAK